MDGIQEQDELTEYLLQPLESVRDPIVWWWDHRMVFPRLSRMALDYLSIPGMLQGVFNSFVLLMPSPQQRQPLLNMFFLKADNSFTLLETVFCLHQFVLSCVWEIGAVGT